MLLKADPPPQMTPLYFDVMAGIHALDNGASSLFVIEGSGQTNYPGINWFVFHFLNFSSGAWVPAISAMQGRWLYHGWPSNCAVQAVRRQPVLWGAPLQALCQQCRAGATCAPFSASPASIFCILWHETYLQSGCAERHYVGCRSTLHPYLAPI